MGERKGRLTHPTLGKCVRYAFRTTDNGKLKTTTAIYPVDQNGRAAHKKHPSGYDESTSKRIGCIAPSCSFYSDLCKYGQFRWSKQQERGE